MGIKDEYESYCFDEVAFQLLTAATEKDGRINWDKIRWKDRRPRDKNHTTNSELIKFIQKHGITNNNNV